jgi:hypothetical protein
MVYAKYEFDTIPDLPEINGTVLFLDKFILSEAQHDENGDIITPATFSDKVHVDILYDDQPLEELEQFRVYPKTPNHYVSGHDKTYLNTLPSID